MWVLANSSLDMEKQRTSKFNVEFLKLPDLAGVMCRNICHWANKEAQRFGGVYSEEVNSEFNY